MTLRTSLLTSTAVALVLCAAPVSAQMSQKEGMPGGSATGGEGRAAQKEQGTQPRAGETGRKSTEPKGMKQDETKGQPGKSTTQSEPSGKSKGSAETQPKEPGTKGSAQTQPKEPSGKGSAQQTQQPTDKGGKGIAETQPREPGTKGSAQTQPREPSGKGSAQTQQPKESNGKGTTATGPSGSERVQLSEQQRTSVHGTILKESNVNRSTNVNFSVNVGTRVPRSVHLAALPAAVLSIVPQYRSYQYFVANDQICIVDPGSYEIVEVIAAPGRTAGRDNRGAMGRLMLTEEEKAIILREVEMDGGSTMGLGAVREGAEVPRNVQVRTFSDAVVQQVPKVQDYKYFAAENRVAVVDPQSSKVELVIEDRR